MHQLHHLLLLILVLPLMACSANVNGKVNGDDVSFTLSDRYVQLLLTHCAHDCDMRWFGSTGVGGTSWLNIPNTGPPRDPSTP